tara:strand:- start:34985 stop:36283 length:1299 start_codon:yes stop_codon:yes gene_type:complete
VKAQQLRQYFAYAVGLYFAVSLLLVRTFVGIYIFGYRIGELIVGASLLALTLFVIFNRFGLINFQLDNKLKLIFELLLFSFVFILFYNNGNVTSVYTYKSSSYIWTLSAFFVGILVYKNFNIDKLLLYLLNPILIMAYLWQVFGTPDSLSNYFLTVSDKFEPHKGSDLAILFVICFILNEKYLSKRENYYIYFFLFSSFYLPFIYFKSRAALIAVVLYLLMVVISNFKSISNQFTILKFITVTIFSILLFLQSVFWVKESGIIKIYEARENVVSLVKTRTQTYVEDAPSLFWISEKRLYSADGNLNWRLDIWQDVILDLSNKDKILFGYGYNEIIPIMEWYGGYRLGLDGLNEHVHNNWFNIFARGGLLHLVLFIFLYIFLVSSYRKKFGDYWIFLLLVPILFVSFFDSSMENAHFPFIYYFFLGRLFVIGK